jgi:hypothetical protein
MALDRSFGQPERSSGICHAQAPIKPQLDDLTQSLVLPLQATNRFVKGQDFLRVVFRGLSSGFLKRPSANTNAKTYMDA